MRLLKARTNRSTPYECYSHEMRSFQLYFLLLLMIVSMQKQIDLSAMSIVYYLFAWLRSSILTNCLSCQMPIKLPRVHLNLMDFMIQWFNDNKKHTGRIRWQFSFRIEINILWSFRLQYFYVALNELSFHIYQHSDRMCKKKLRLSS